MLLREYQENPKKKIKKWLVKNLMISKKNMSKVTGKDEYYRLNEYLRFQKGFSFMEVEVQATDCSPFGTLFIISSRSFRPLSAEGFERNEELFERYGLGAR